MSTPRRRQLGRDLVAGVAALVLAGAYWAGADAIPRSALIGDGIGADALPKSLAGALAVFSLMLIGRSAWLWRRADARRDENAIAEEWRRHLRAVGMLVIGVVFLLVLEHLGYVVSLFALVCATAVYNGRPVDRALWLFGGGLTLVFYLLFVKLLGIPLPAGFWPGLVG